nr:hypothetical protein [uncultured Desulfobacter sp.]
MSQKTINALDELVSMLEPDQFQESLAQIRSCVANLFRSPKQLYFAIVVMALLLIGMHMKNKLILDHGLPNMDILFATVPILISAQMIWFLTGSLFLMHKLYNLKDLSINPLSPSKTLGLEKMISVIGTYNNPDQPGLIHWMQHRPLYRLARRDKLGPRVTLVFLYHPCTYFLLGLPIR